MSGLKIRTLTRLTIDGGVTLIGNLDMTMDSNVLSGNVSIKEGRMTTPEDANVCVISEELAEKGTS